jgi:hypothetical protein
MEVAQKHRVRLFVYEDKENLNKEELFWKVADLFQVTDKYKWAESAGIKLEYDVHDNHKWVDGNHVLIYADLDDTKYSDYILNFYEFEKEDWK